MNAPTKPPDLNKPRPETQPALFRREALDAQQDDAFGRVIIEDGRVASWAIVVAIGAIVAMVFATTQLTYTRKLSATGILVPSGGASKISAGQPGVVTAISFKEGQEVATGDALFEVTRQRLSVASGDADQVIVDLLNQRKRMFGSEEIEQRKQAALRSRTIEAKRQELDVEKLVLTEQQRTQEERVDLAKQAVDRFAELENLRFVSFVQVQAKRADYLDQKQRLADIRKTVAANTRDQALLSAEKEGIATELEKALSLLRRSVAELDQQIAEAEVGRNFVVRAKYSGRITGLTVALGDTVSASQSLATLLPTSRDLICDLYVPTSAIAFVNRGMRVQLRYEAFAYQKYGQFGGTVIEISEAGLSPEEFGLSSVALFASSAPRELLYRVRARPDNQVVSVGGEDLSLRPGMKVQASLLLESKTLLSWIVDPVKAAVERTTK